jgi:NAD-dependent deacetylase
MSGAPCVVCLTGAGVSADSGLATFRDAGGLWEGRRPEEVATPSAWRIDRELVWRFYQMRRRRLLEVAPNPAHHALARLEQACRAAGAGFTLISQNVDDLHQRAGSTVLAMHGQLLDLRCERCSRVLRDAEHFADALLPCAACGHDALRPDVVWFGEMPYHLDEIERALERCTHFLAIGTSGVVYPAAGLLSAARRLGAETIVNSLDAPENLHALDRFVPGPAAEVVPRLVDELCARLGLAQPEGAGGLPVAEQAD